MTIQASKFTPEVLLAAPRRSEAFPNFTGELLLYTACARVSSYSFETHTQSSQIRVLKIKEDVSLLVSEDPTASEPIWIADDEIAYIKTLDNGGSALVAQHVEDKDRTSTIHNFTAGISSPKAKQLSSGQVAFCCAAPTDPSGNMHDPAAGPKSYSTAKIYTDPQPRYWDKWRGSTQKSLWYGQLERSPDGQWTLANGTLLNLLAGTRLSCPVGPFGGTGDFDVSATGVAFVAKDPYLNPARFTKTDLYYVPIGSFSHRAALPRIVETSQLQGYSNSPAFSHDGKQVAFARMRSNKNENDKARLLLVPDVTNLGNVQEFFATPDGRGAWDFSPQWVLWSHDDEHLYVAAEKHASTVLWKLPSSPAEARALPTPIQLDGSLSGASVLGEGPSLVVTTSSLVESSTYSIIDITNAAVKTISSSSKQGRSFGLSPSQCSEIWFKGAGEYDVHALVVVPSDFDPGKKYPLALIVHGGPQAATLNGWSTRWNPAIFAEQGYVVVCPNPTGSTGYGQDFLDAILGQWGARPYQDLVKCFDHFETNVDYVDTDRAVALGASFGGFMMNYIQGMDLGRKFKALVCHDGVFSTSSLWSTDELFFLEKNFKGTPWESRDEYEKWDPSRFTANWTTPHLIIHNEQDFRLDISEGLNAYNVLQTLGVPSKLVVFSDENHWVLKPENALVWHQVVLEWINKYSGVSGE